MSVSDAIDQPAEIIRSEMCSELFSVPVALLIAAARNMDKGQNWPRVGLNY